MMLMSRPSDITIIQQDHPSEEETQLIYGQLRASNKLHTGELLYKSLHLFAYGPEQQVVGGLFGEIGWGWLHVSSLWVADHYRRRGLGAKLLEQAEAEAQALGITRGYLETTSFQARPFYAKMGYDVFAQLEDLPPGHTCYYMKKYFV